VQQIFQTKQKAFANCVAALERLRRKWLA